MNTYYCNADEMALHLAQERDEAAHTVSIWNSNKRGTGARRLVAVGHTRNEDAGRPRDEGNRKWFEARHARDFERFDCAPLWVF